ncbi:MAG: helix-hairpin-helix domain-containing protein, partial [Actinobacteria bacterium]|nr:helix-hairpin-helix domain-containing protein [Actinomycetota bacterium]
MIMSKDSDLVRRIPGIGKKLAERIIMELQDKFKEEEMLEGPLYQGILEDDNIFEVKQALKTLGYNSKEINKAISKVKLEDIKDKKVEEILRKVLKEV